MLWLASGCSLRGSRRPIGIQLRLSGIDRPVKHRTRREVLSAPPADLTLMDCFLVNVGAADIAPGIPAATLGGTSASCLGLGETSQLVSYDELVERGVSLRATPGSRRRIQVWGILTKTATGCQGKSSLAEIFASGTTPWVFAVGTTETDLRLGATITIQNDYSSETTPNLGNTCTTPTPPNPPAPVLGSFLPLGGALAGGTLLTIHGSDFLHHTKVTVGGVDCAPVNVISDSVLKCTTGPHAAGPVFVEVTNPDGQVVSLSGYTYQAAPTVSLVTSSTGPDAGGDSVTVTGNDFLTGATVDFGGTACGSVSVVNSTTITCTTGAHTAGTVDVTVTNTDGQAGKLPAGYTYLLPSPAISGFSPSIGPIDGGTTLTISGSDFQASATVDVAGAACAVTSLSSSTIVCTTGAQGATSGAVTVTNPDSQFDTSGSNFTYAVPPTVLGILPGSGNTGGGTSVTIGGSDFVSGATVLIGDADCGSVSVVSSSSLTCITGTTVTSGLADVTVTNPDSLFGTLTDGFNYTSGASVQVTGVTPSAGSAGGGTAVTVDGNGFQSGASVDFGGSPCADVDVNSSIQLTCRTSAHASASVTVAVTNPDTSNGSLLSAFSYGTAPTISSVAPSSVSAAAPTGITISGNDFVSPTSILIQGQPCTGPVLASSTTLTCNAPGLVGGWADIDITFSGGMTAYKANMVKVGSNDAWYSTSAVSAPASRAAATAVWTGSRMLLWGGQDASGAAFNTGGMYNPFTDTWLPMSTVGAPSARFKHTAVWDGTKMIVWGGFNGATPLADGAAFDPDFNKWFPLATGGTPPAARQEHSAVWADDRMLVWGGSGAATPLNDGGAYFPSTGWGSLATPSLAARGLHSAIWTGALMLIYNGFDGTTTFNSGGYYDKTLNQWTAANTGLTGRKYHSTVWTGSNALFWGGDDGSTFTDTGEILDPTAGTGGLGAWTAIPPLGAPTARGRHTAAWMDSVGKMIVWGGTASGTSGLNDGGIFLPPSTWSTPTATGAPAGTFDAASVWTGRQFIVWGGFSSASIVVNNGGRYTP